MSRDGRQILQEADAATSSGDARQGRALLREARFAFSRSADLVGLAAVMRREALTLEGEERRVALREAIRLSRRAADPEGEAEGLEELSRAHSEAGEVSPAIALLGLMADVHAARKDREGQIRATELAGRLLCEAWGSDRDPPSGLVMLLWAGDACKRANPDLSSMIQRYIEGYQYTLSDAEFARVEALLDLDRLAVVDATFARHRLAVPHLLP